MPELTPKQKQWLKELFLKYFPHVCIDKFLVEKIEKYLRFAENDQSLDLPQHLQYDENPNPAKKIGLDVPAMLGEEPFSSLIKNIEYLDVLKEKIEKEVFSVFGYLVRKDYGEKIEEDEAIFLKEFRQAFNSSIEYDENIPELFFKTIGTKGILAKYNLDENRFVWEYTWDFEYILAHSPHDLTHGTARRSSAYQYFARKVYNLRGFGASKEIKATDYKTLNALFLNYLEETNDFYQNIISGYKDTVSNLKNYDKHSYKKQRDFGWMSAAFIGMVNYELEGVKDKNLYAPTKLATLIEKINNQSNPKELRKFGRKTGLLAGYNDEIEKEVFTIKEENFVRPIFKDIYKIYKHCDSSYLSEKSKDMLESANMGGVAERLKGLYSLWGDRDELGNRVNQNFLNIPAVQKVFTKKKKHDLACLYWKPYVSSMDKNMEDSEKTLHDLRGDNKNYSFEDSVIYNKVMNDISVFIKGQFSNDEDNSFVKELKMFINEENLTRHNFGPNNKKNNLYDKYKELRTAKVKNFLTEDEFYEKMEKVLHYINNEITEKYRR